MTVNREKILFGLILLIGAILLFANLGQYDIWGDEALTFPKGDSYAQVLKYTRLVGGTVHPPTYSLLQYTWIKLVAGWDTVKNRELWAFFGFLNLILVYFLAREVFDRKTGLMALLICSLSPFLIQYSRMVRYYPLTAFFALLTFWAFFRFRRTQSKKDLIFFVLAAVLFIYEDYLATFVLFFMYLYLLINYHLYKQQFVKWLLVAGVICLLILPLIPLVFTQTSGGIEPYPEHVAKVMDEAPRIAQKAVGLKGLIVNSILKFGFLSYVFTLGETTYFWRWWITIPVLLTCLMLFLGSIFRMKTPEGRNAGVLTFLLIASLIATIIISELYGIFGSRMFQFPSKVLFLAPILFILIARGLTSLRSPKLAIVLAIILLAGQAYGLNNYFSGRQFLNPKYLVPWRQIEMDIQSHSAPQDLILSDEEAFFHTLKADQFPIETFGLVGAVDKIQDVLQKRGPHSAFLVIRYRGDETIVVEALRVLDQLKKCYPLVDTWHYVPADPEATPYWKKLLGREPNPFLVDVYCFQVTEKHLPSP